TAERLPWSGLGILTRSGAPETEPVLVKCNAPVDSHQGEDEAQQSQLGENEVGSQIPALKIEFWVQVRVRDLRKMCPDCIAREASEEEGHADQQQSQPG